MRILLVNSNQMKPGVAPIGLDYLADALVAAGHQVALLDLCFAADYRAEIDGYLARHSADAVGVTVRNTDDCYYASQDFFLPRIKEMTDHLRARTGAPIVLGGVGFSLMPEAILRYCQLDVGIVGEGEEAFPALLGCWEEGRDPHHLPGLVYKAADGYQRNAPRFLELDRLPPRRREAADNPRYLREGAMGNIETKRGCTGACLYCADPVGKGRQYRLRSPLSVADEIEVLAQKGVNYLHLCDSEFNLPEEHAKAVCQEMIRRRQGDHVHWYTYASPIPFSRELARLMRRAGCQGVNFGVDSGCDAMLRRLRRNFTAQDLRETARICHQEKLVFMYDLLLGGPGETAATVKETLDLMKEVSPSRVGVAVGLRIYPETGLAEIARREGITSRNPNLHGAIEGNDDLLRPIFYLSAAEGVDLFSYAAGLVEGDPRFFVGSKGNTATNYNYNDNSVLVEAIRQGHRGAFWDILRRISGA